MDDFDDNPYINRITIFVAKPRCVPFSFTVDEQMLVSDFKAQIIENDPDLSD